MEIGDRLRQLRRHIGINQIDFAHSIGLKQGSYSDLERGKSGLSNHVKNALFEKYKVNIDWLLNGDGNMFEKTNIENQSNTVAGSGANITGSGNTIGNINSDNSFENNSLKKEIEELKKEINRLKDELIKSKDELSRSKERIIELMSKSNK